MMQIKLFKMPTRSLAYLLICSLGILSFIAIGHYPLQRSLERMDREIAKIRCNIEEQNILFPVYSQLMEKIQFKRPNILLYPVKTKFSMDKIEELPSIFEKIAGKCNLTVLSVIPDIKSLGNDSGFLLIDVVVKGNFFDFRKFLLELGKVACIEEIEEIRIERAANAKECSLKIWLAVS